MGTKKGMVVACAVAVVSILSLITVILGIAGVASAAQSVVSDDKTLSCEYQASPAVGCGVAAALMALTTQILASAATGCCGCCRTWGIPSEAKRIVAVVLCTFSWVLSIIVVILFMVGAIASAGWDLLTSDDNGKCVPPGIGEFAAATILFLISVVFQITSCILLQATAVAGSTKPLAQESGIAMGEPAEPVNNAEQKGAAAGGPPPLAPTVSSEANVAPAPPLLSTMAPKANSESTSHV